MIRNHCTHLESVLPSWWCPPVLCHTAHSKCLWYDTLDLIKLTHEMPEAFQARKMTVPPASCSLSTVKKWHICQIKQEKQAWHFILSKNFTAITSQVMERHTKSAQIRKISQTCLVALVTGTVSRKMWMSLTSKPQTNKTSLIFNSVEILHKSKSIFTALIC